MTQLADPDHLITSWELPLDANLWLPAQRLFPEQALLRMPLRDQRQLLRTFRRQERAAFLCFRLARWQTNAGQLHVICIKCGARGWSYCSRGSERRWICSKANNHGCEGPRGKKAKGKAEAGPKRTPLEVCNKRFWDRSETPLSGSCVPIPYVFLAFYYSPEIVAGWLDRLGLESEKSALQEVLRRLNKGQYQKLRQGLTVMARVFCGKVLCAKYKSMTLRYGGYARIKNKLYAASGERQKAAAAHKIVMERRKQAVTRITSHYEKARRLIEELVRMEVTAFPDQRASHAQRKKIIGELTAICRDTRHLEPT